MDVLSIFSVGIAVAATTAALTHLLLFRNQRSTVSYPPGPTVVSMPTDDAWVQYRNWGREYGELVYIRERNILIINNSRVAIDLLEKRARIYSDRQMTTMSELCGGELIITFERYSNKWRRDRKLFQQNFRQAAMNRFHPAQYDKVHELLRNLITSPDKFRQHTLALSQRLIFAALYGLDINPEDPLAQKAVKAAYLLGQTQISGTFPAIEKFSWLRLMPSWFPGCGFKRLAEQCLKDIKEVDAVLLDMTMDKLNAGLGTSLMAELATKSDGNVAEFESIKAMGTVSFLAAADTTTAAISCFLLEMTLHPGAQAKGQEEIDRVVGRDRLPTFEDRPSLPYVEAIYREVMRLNPSIPLGFAHTSFEDDFYHGYHIPKGCIVTPNIWAMNRDPDVYTAPDEFIPERFLDTPTGPFTSINDIYAFGFGRRVCVGRYMADNTVWMTIASVLATLTLRKAKDMEGNEIDIPEEYTSNFFRHPKPYRSSILPRDSHAQELILATVTR